jgi:hypothetical protein
MNGDPFAVAAEKAKRIYFGLRDYFLGVVEDEKGEYEAAHNVQLEIGVVPKPYDDCPTCGATRAIREPAAGVMRCSSCGWQPRVYNPPGSINRKSLDSFQDFDVKHKQKFARGFVEALSRFGRK